MQLAILLHIASKDMTQIGLKLNIFLQQEPMIVLALPVTPELQYIIYINCQCLCVTGPEEKLFPTQDLEHLQGVWI